MLPKLKRHLVSYKQQSLARVLAIKVGVHESKTILFILSFDLLTFFMYGCKFFGPQPTGCTVSGGAVPNRPYTALMKK